MSTQDSDGIDDALQGVSYVAMTAAARLGEQVARTREQQARKAQAESEQAALEFAARMGAEKDAARASLAVVHHPEWWDSAQAEDVTKAYQTARAWRDLDTEAVRAEQKIVDEVRNRFGTDVTRDSDPAAVAEAIERAERARAEAADQRDAAGTETVEAVGLLTGADAADRRAEMQADQQHLAEDRGDPDDVTRHAADRETGEDTAAALRHDAGQVYDSAERREALAGSLDHIENKAAVEARLRSDAAQSRPATDATTNTTSRSPKAHKTRGTAQTARTSRDPDGRGRTLQ